MTTTPTETRGSGRWGGIGLGGILVIAGIVVALVWSVLLGVIIAVIGLVAFGVREREVVLTQVGEDFGDPLAPRATMKSAPAACLLP